MTAPIEMITRELSHGTPAVRLDAVEALGQGRGCMGEFLENLLVNVLRTDLDPIVRHEAAFSLGKLMQRNAIPGRCASRQLCVSAVEDKSVIVRHEAIEALWCFKDLTVQTTVKTLLDDRHPDIRATAKITLERLQDS